MKTWINWIVTLFAITIILSGVTLVFALGNENNFHESSPIEETETSKIASNFSELYQTKALYKIQSGDSLWKLTTNYVGNLGRQDVILQIMAYNDLTDATKLQIHQVIYLPGCLSLAD